MKAHQTWALVVAKRALSFQFLNLMFLPQIFLQDGLFLPKDPSLRCKMFSIPQIRSGLSQNSPFLGFLGFFIIFLLINFKSITFGLNLMVLIKFVIFGCLFYPLFVESRVLILCFLDLLCRILTLGFAWIWEFVDFSLYTSIHIVLMRRSLKNLEKSCCLLLNVWSGKTELGFGFCDWWWWASEALNFLCNHYGWD